jgi:hypothetical protein
MSPNAFGVRCHPGATRDESNAARNEGLQVFRLPQDARGALEASSRLWRRAPRLGAGRASAGACGALMYPSLARPHHDRPENLLK